MEVFPSIERLSAFRGQRCGALDGDHQGFVPCSSGVHRNLAVAGAERVRIGSAEDLAGH